MKTFRSFLIYLIKILFQPVVLISLFGPLILTVNLLSLRDALAFPYGVVGISGDFIELKKVLSDAWSYALLDFNVQLYTLLLAWILFFVEVVGLGLKLISRYSITRLKDVIKDSTESLILSIVIVILFFGGIIVLFSGTLSGPNTVEYYLPNGLNINGGIRIPPLNSGITWFRGIILISGVLLSIWEMRVLPDIMKKTNE